MPAERKFIGFDAYQKAMDCLKPGDIAIFTTPLAFRWVHFTYAIEKGLNVFMEKPLTADGPTSRRMLKLARRRRGQKPQSRGGLDVPSQPGDAGTGPPHPGRRNRRHHPAARLPDARPGGSCSLAEAAGHQRIALADSALPQLPLGQRRLLQRLLHPPRGPSLLDEERLAGQGPGAGRTPLSHKLRRRAYVDQNFDTYSVEYTFADGAKFIMDGRCMDGLQGHLLQLRARHQGHGRSSPRAATAGALQHVQGPESERSNLLWKSKVTPANRNPYQNEWNDLLDAIRNDKPYNEVKRGVEASL